MHYRRYAIYDLPDIAPLASSGARWLGWDVNNGTHTRQPELDGIEDATSTPRKYGFHATLKPPFRLAEDASVETLIQSLQALSATTGVARCEGLQVTTLGKFLALTPLGSTEQINALAFNCVRVLDSLRAPLNDAELARRRTSPLTEAQEQLLQQWGYPYVGDEFRYHITLTGKLDPEEVEQWQFAADNFFSLPSPYVIESLALVGEREDGFFELIQRFKLFS